MKKEILLEDTGLSINITHTNEDDLHVDFVIHKYGTWWESDTDKGISYHDEAADNGWETKDNHEEALPFIQGSLKWDGCINYTYPGQESCMLHGCGLYTFSNISKTMQVLYNETAVIFKDRAKSDYLNDELIKDKERLY